LQFQKPHLNINLTKYLLPEEILDYFEIVTDKIQNDQVHFYLEKKNILPQEHQSEIAQSKGFTIEIIVEGFSFKRQTRITSLKT